MTDPSSPAQPGGPDQPAPGYPGQGIPDPAAPSASGAYGSYGVYGPASGPYPGADAAAPAPGPVWGGPAPKPRPVALIVTSALAAVLFIAAAALGALYYNEHSAHDKAARQLRDTKTSLVSVQAQLSDTQSKLDSADGQVTSQKGQIDQLTKTNGDLTSQNATLSVCANAAKAADTAVNGEVNNPTDANVQAALNAIESEISACK